MRGPYKLYLSPEALTFGGIIARLVVRTTKDVKKEKMVII